MPIHLPCVVCVSVECVQVNSFLSKAYYPPPLLPLSPLLLRHNMVGASPSRHHYPPPPGGPSSSSPVTRRDILGTVPETSHSGARVVDVTFGPPMSPSSVLSSTVASQGPAPRSGGGVPHQQGPRSWASGARSMDTLHQTPPQPRREAPPYRWVCPLFFYLVHMLPAVHISHCLL